MWPRSPTTTSREPATAPSSSIDSVASGAFTAFAAPAPAGARSPSRRASTRWPALVKYGQGAVRAAILFAWTGDTSRGVGFGVFKSLRAKGSDSGRRL